MSAPSGVKRMELMSEGQWKRWDAVARLAAGKLTVGEAARVLGLSVRQVRRIRRRVGAGGRAGLQHGNRGQVPVNKLRAAVRARILRLRRGRYRDFNDVHLARLSRGAADRHRRGDGASGIAGTPPAEGWPGSGRQRATACVAGRDPVGCDAMTTPGADIIAGR